MWLALDLFASDKSCETSPEDDRQQQKNVDNGKVGYRLAIVFLFRDFLFLLLLDTGKIQNNCRCLLTNRNQQYKLIIGK